MRSRGLLIIWTCVCITIAAGLTGCGGGGGGSSTSVTAPPSTQSLVISSNPTLPAGVQGHSYTTTLTATNGQGALHWSISPPGPTGVFATGLTIDPNSGAISGTINFSGAGGFNAQVTDSASPPRTAIQGFSIFVYPPLTSANTQTATLTEFQGAFGVQTGIQGGVPPIHYSITSGSTPPGITVNNGGQLSGAAYASGTYQFVLTATDSVSPPEVATQPFTVTVQPPPLSVANSIPSRILFNRPFSANVVATGGTPPYTFSSQGQNLPPGLGLDSSTGVVSGTPSTQGTYNFTITASDASSPRQSSQGFFSVQVAAPLSRNDSPATATPISNGAFQGSISPYIDPTNGTPTPGDNDYYKLVSSAGSTVHVETVAKSINPNNPLDTVIEIVDGNGVQLNTCRLPGDTSTNFTSACINDDKSATPHLQDSALDLQVPAANTTFYVHVFDFRGDARPDMVYSLQVSGVTP